jgi:hypothetical protein
MPKGAFLSFPTFDQRPPSTMLENRLPTAQLAKSLVPLSGPSFGFAIDANSNLVGPKLKPVKPACPGAIMVHLFSDRRIFASGRPEET